MGYKEDIQIDVDQLDQEWIKQASLYQYYAKQEATALYERDQLVDTLTLVQAKLDGDIRLNFGKYGFESKPTEAAILNSIKQNLIYTEANSLVMKASCKAKIIGGAVRAFDHKKKALEKLTDLYLSGYWAAPKIKSEAQEIFGKQTREDMEKALRKEDRMIKASLKREAGADTKAEKKTEGKPKVTTQRAKNERDAKKGVVADKKRAEVKTKSVIQAKVKAGGKRKPKPTKPVGRTKEVLLKQNRSTPSPRSSRKKK
jgi:hypothetical protein